jgi:hypothetical protein
MALRQVSFVVRRVEVKIHYPFTLNLKLSLLAHTNNHKRRPVIAILKAS